MEKRTVTNYNQEFKDQVIKMVLKGKSTTELSRELGIPESTIRTWVQMQKRDPKEKQEQTEIKKLLKELRDVTEERDILKKAISIFSKNPEKNMNS